MYCRFCGKEIPDDAKFCSYCGKSLEFNPEMRADEVKKEEKVDENLKAFKKDYSRGALPGLIWFAALNVIASTFLGIGYAIVLMIFFMEGNTVSFDLNDLGNYLTQFTDKSYFIIVPIMYTIGYLIASILAMIIGKRIVYGKKGKETTYPKNIRKLGGFELVLVALVAFGLWGIGVIIGNFPSFFVEESNNQIEMIFGNYTVIYLIQAMFFAPIVEEYFFRKLIIDKVASRGEGLAILASATLFGLMHGNLGQFFLAFLIGLLFGLVYIKTRNIKYTMMLHFMINTTASLPEIFGLFNVDIAIPWYIIVASLSVAGIVMGIIFRKKEIFKINKWCEYDGYLIHRSAGYEVFFLVTLITLATTSLTLNIVDITGGASLLQLTELVPIGAFIAFIILYNRQVHKIFKGEPKAINDGEIVYSEPAEYFSEEARKEFGLGEVNDIEKDKEETHKLDE